MIITYFRSSSYNTHDMCPMQFFSEYVLGWRGPGGLKADKGTIVHKVLEIIADAKIAHQQGKGRINIKDLGRRWTICKKNILTSGQVDNICEAVFGWYSEAQTQHNWAERDYKDCHKWVLKALDFNEGEFDPRNKDIIEAEATFDFEINEPWAFYDYGNDLQGFLSLKGTIDQVNRIDKDTIEILDWKTGRRLNWATGQEKDYAALQKDPQLRIYHYAATKMWPDVKNIMVTIYYINDGGPFTLCFGPDDLVATEKMLKKKFDVIKADKNPKLNISWKCRKFCHQGKSTFEGTDIIPLKMKHDGHVSRRGETMSKCEQLQYALKHRSIESVMENMTKPGHNVADYHAPGVIE